MITDFDATLSKHHHDETPETRLPGSMTILEQHPTLPQATKQFCRGNFEKYYKIEMNTEISNTEKLPHMVEWWTSSLNTVISAKTINRKNLKEHIQNCGMILRINADQFLKKLNENQVPCLVFSAGCGNVIEEFLKNKQPINCYDDNMVVCSNDLIFEEDADENLQYIVGLREGSLIHSLNKSEALDRLKRIPDQKSFNKLNQLLTRPNDANQNPNSETLHLDNVLLLGDHIRDINMKNGMQKIQNSLNIGFLNTQIEKNLENFLQAWDIVLVDDQSFDVVNKIVDWLLA